MSFNHPFNTVPFNYAIPASQTPEGRERERAYYEALGRFIQMFAEAEKVLAQTLWAYAGTSAAVAKFVFAGVQTEQAGNYIKAIAPVQGADKETQDDLENALSQLGVIRGVRNDILHYGATQIAEGRGVVSNAWKAKAVPTVLPISAKALTDMESDLRKIIAHLGYRHLGRPWPRAPLNVQMLETILQAPWRYKRPSPPPTVNRKGEVRRSLKSGQ